MTEHNTDSKTLRIVVVTPERPLVDEPADFVSVPLFDGQLGVLPGRAPLVGKLTTGSLKLRSGGQEKLYFIDGGFVQVRANVVSVLTPRALKPEEINVADANHVLQEVISDKPAAEREKITKAKERARVQLRLVGAKAETAAPH
jgi:F-type H+-transporting ATPase subunit epsilon